MASKFEEVRIRVFGWVPCDMTSPCGPEWSCVRHAGLWELIEAAREDERTELVVSLADRYLSSSATLVESMNQMRRGEGKVVRFVGEGTPWTS